MPTIENHILELQAAFSEELTKVSRKLRTLFDARVRASGLTLARARMLMLLAKSDCLTQTELAVALEVEGPTLVRLLDGLEKQGLIARKPVKGDRRAKQITLTDAGRKQTTKVSRIAANVREEVLSGINEVDLATTVATLRAIAAKIESAS